MNLQPLQTFIQERIGLHFGGDTGTQWRALLAHRIERVSAGSADDYLARLHQDEAELHRLTSLLTINETYFYREPQHLTLLTERLCPELLAHQQAGARVRILSVGCSSGEEPYSILIALHERYGELAESLFEINAGDVDQVALARARAGRYSPFAFRAFPSTLIGRYFTPADGAECQINESIRRQVRFQPFNLLAPAYPAELQGQDVIFFRNVSIYFDVPTRRHVLEQLKGLLNPGGSLIVGIAETLANDFGVLTLCERDGVFFFCNRPVAPPVSTAPISLPRAAADRLSRGDATARSALPARLPAKPLSNPDRRRASHPAHPRLTSPPSAAPRPAPTAHNGDQEALALAQAERFDEALARLAPRCAGQTPHVQDLALLAHLLLERRDVAGATLAAQRALELDPWCLDALLLLARIAQNQGDHAIAIAHLRRAIYHRPNAWRAHFQLAEIYRGGGQTELARREYRILLHQLQQRAAADPSGDSDAGLLPSPLSLHDVRLLCETRLARLDTAAD